MSSAAQRLPMAALAAAVFVCAGLPVCAQEQPAARFPSAAKRNHGPVDPPNAEPRSEWARRDRPRYDYVLHCSGCHFMHGEGMASAGIPRVRDQIGYFLAIPEGRAYLMQVPGLLTAGLGDEGAAGVVNWMVEYFGGPSRPADFVPYTAEEARRYRLERPADIGAKRRRIVAELEAAGYRLR